MHRGAPPPVRAGRGAFAVAALAARLTPRDRQLCRLLWEHRVLTSHQIAEVAFPILTLAQRRLTTLAELEVVDRFRPLVLTHTGSAPYHYTLGPAGAAVLAAENDQTVRDLGYRRDVAQRIAHNQHLAHVLGCNGFFTALLRHARHHDDADLLEWWPERRCAAAFGAAVRPDAYGRWREHGATVAFHLEHDNASEWVQRVAGKLPGYAALFRAQRAWRPVLLWLPTTARERSVRRAIPHGEVPVATAARDSNPDPADAIWLPITAPATGPRYRLAQLADPAVWSAGQSA